MSILGTRVVRIEDPRFLRGEGTYIANLPLEGAVHITYVRSTMAHARILSIDTAEAAAMPGSSTCGPPPTSTSRRLLPPTG